MKYYVIFKDVTIDECHSVEEAEAVASEYNQIPSLIVNELDFVELAEMMHDILMRVVYKHMEKDGEKDE